MVPYANTPRNRILGIEEGLDLEASGWCGVSSYVERNVGSSGLCGAGMSAYAGDASYSEPGDIQGYEEGGAGCEY